MLTDNHLLREQTNEIGGVQRIYKFPSGYGLSAINSPIAHSYSYAWEFAVLKNVQDDGTHEGLDYTTSLTNDVYVCLNENEANEFIERAVKEIGNVTI